MGSRNNRWLVMMIVALGLLDWLSRAWLWLVVLPITVRVARVTHSVLVILSFMALVVMFMFVAALVLRVSNFMVMVVLSVVVMFISLAVVRIFPLMVMFVLRVVVQLIRCLV